MSEMHHVVIALKEPNDTHHPKEGGIEPSPEARLVEHMEAVEQAIGDVGVALHLPLTHLTIRSLLHVEGPTEEIVSLVRSLLEKNLLYTLTVEDLGPGEAGGEG